MIPIIERQIEAVIIDNKALVKNMLAKLKELGKDISRKINNTHSNGINNTIFEIQIFEQDAQTGLIAYQTEDGHVINYRCKDIEKILPIQIMDMLLCIISYELNAD